MLRTSPVECGVLHQLLPCAAAEVEVTTGGEVEGHGDVLPLLLWAIQEETLIHLA